MFPLFRWFAAALGGEVKSERQSWKIDRNRVVRSQVHRCLDTFSFSQNCDLLGRQLDIVFPGFAYDLIAEIFIRKCVAISNARAELRCHVMHIVAQLNIRQLTCANLPSDAAEYEENRDPRNDLYVSLIHDVAGCNRIIAAVDSRSKLLRSTRFCFA